MTQVTQASDLRKQCAHRVEKRKFEHFFAIKFSTCGKWISRHFAVNWVCPTVCRVRIDELDRQVVAIAVPAFAALVSEPLMLAVDTAIVGHLGKESLAALGAAGTALTTVIGLCVFLAYSSTAAVARQRGAGDPAKAMQLAMSGIWLAVVIGFFATAGTVALTGPIAKGLSSSPAVTQLTTDYLNIAVFSIPPALLVLAATGALRGVLDLRTPLIVMIAANGLNAILTAWFMIGLGLGLRGAAWGLVIAQSAAAVSLVAMVLRRVRNTSASWKPRWAAVLNSALDGAPLFVRTITLRAVFLLATWVASGMGDGPLAAHQIVTTVVFLLSFVLDALAIAAQTLVGGTLGARDTATTRRVTDRLMVWGMLGGAVLGASLAATASWVPLIFTSDQDVRTAAVGALVVVGFSLPLGGLVYILDGILIGAGDNVYLALAGIFTLVVHAPLAWLVHSADLGLVWLWWAWVAFMAARGLTLWLRQRGQAWMVLSND